MKQRTFEQKHQADWQQLEHWLAALSGKKKHNIKKQELEQFAYLYRQVCQHLALAQSRHYTPYLIERLNYLVLMGHQLLYTRRSRFIYQTGNFLIQTLPQTVRANWRLITLSALLFFGSFFIMFVSVKLNPSLIYSLMDYEQVIEFEAMYHPSNERAGQKRDADSNFMMFGYYIYNNISIGFRTYSSGLLFGIGSLFFIIFNGIFIGAVAGYLTQVGYGTVFFSFVSGHSAPELIAIVIAGAAGLKLGQSLIAPKRHSRLHALQQAARDSLPLVYGVIVLLLLAAFIEAFWSSMMNISPLIKYGFGLSLWLLLLVYFIFGGQHRGT